MISNLEENVKQNEQEKTILHIDVNNFFASVECAKNPNLRSLPIAVTGNPKMRNGIILAKNEIAKSFGVSTGEAIWQAKEKCPNLVCLPPHYTLYEKVSLELHKLYLTYTDLVEPLGLDECWLDVTPSLKYLKMTGKEIADEIRLKVEKKFNFTVSVGVSFSKIFAKLGSDLKKPNATTVIPKAKFKELTYHLPLDSIIGIGSRLFRRFENMNITTIGEFANLDTSIISSIMGKTGRELQQKLNGTFDEKIESYYQLSPPKSIGNGTTTIVDIKEPSKIAKVIAFLCEEVSGRLARGNLFGRVMTVTIKTADFKKFRHSKKIGKLQSFDSVYHAAINVLNEFWEYKREVRAIRVRVSDISKIDKFVQLSMFEKDNLTLSIEKIKNKYGENKIFLASDKSEFINNKNPDEKLNK